MIGRELGLSAFLESHVIEAYQLALPFAEAVGICGKFRERIHHKCVDSLNFRQTVELGMLLEELTRHERSLPRRTLLIPFGHAELLESIVFTDIHTGKIEYHFLTHTIVEIQVIRVDGDGQSSSLVLNDE